MFFLQNKSIIVYRIKFKIYLSTVEGSVIRHPRVFRFGQVWWIVDLANSTAGRLSLLVDTSRHTVSCFGPVCRSSSRVSRVFSTYVSRLLSVLHPWSVYSNPRFWFPLGILHQFGHAKNFEWLLVDLSINLVTTMHMAVQFSRVGTCRCLCPHNIASIWLLSGLTRKGRKVKIIAGLASALTNWYLWTAQNASHCDDGIRCTFK